MNALASQAQTSHVARANTDRVEALYRSLAQEIAKDIVEVDDILRAHGITKAQFETIQINPTFQAMLLSEMQVWSSAKNAPERIKQKMLGIIEASAGDFFQHLVGPGTLKDKTALLAVVMKAAGVGVSDNAANNNGGGNQVHIHIDMGGAPMTKDVTLSGIGIDNSVNREATDIDYTSMVPDDEENDDDE